MTLTAPQIQQYLRAREEAGAENYLPLIDSPTDAMYLFSVFGRSTFKEYHDNNVGKNVIVKFAIPVYSHLTEEQRDDRATKFINSMRSSMSKTRAEIKKQTGRTLIKFSMFNQGWENHINGECIILSLRYEEDRNINKLSASMKDLADLLGPEV